MNLLWYGTAVFNAIELVRHLTELLRQLTGFQAIDQTIDHTDFFQHLFHDLSTLGVLGLFGQQIVGAALGDVFLALERFVSSVDTRLQGLHADRTTSRLVEQVPLVDGQFVLAGDGGSADAFRLVGVTHQLLQAIGDAALFTEALDVVFDRSGVGQLLRQIRNQVGCHQIGESAISTQYADLFRYNRSAMTGFALWTLHLNLPFFDEGSFSYRLACLWYPGDRVGQFVPTISIEGSFESCQFLATVLEHAQQTIGIVTEVTEHHCEIGIAPGSGVAFITHEASRLTLGDRLQVGRAKH